MAKIKKLIIKTYHVISRVWMPLEFKFIKLKNGQQFHSIDAKLQQMWDLDEVKCQRCFFKKLMHFKTTRCQHFFQQNDVVIIIKKKCCGLTPSDSCCGVCYKIIYITILDHLQNIYIKKKGTIFGRSIQSNSN